MPGRSLYECAVFQEVSLSTECGMPRKKEFAGVGPSVELTPVHHGQKGRNPWPGPQLDSCLFPVCLLIFLTLS